MLVTLISPFDYQRAVSDLANLGMTQTEIGNAIGVSQGRVSQILKGIDSDKLKYETKLQLKALCDKQGVKTCEVEQAIKNPTSSN